MKTVNLSLFFSYSYKNLTIFTSNIIPCKQLRLPGFFILFSVQKRPTLTEVLSENWHSSTCSIISSPAVGIKGSPIHPLQGSCLGYLLVPYFCWLDLFSRRCVSCAAKKTALFLAWTTWLAPIALVFHPHEFQIAPLAQNGGGHKVHELHQLYFAEGMTTIARMRREWAMMRGGLPSRLKMPPIHQRANGDRCWAVRILGMDLVLPNGVDSIKLSLAAILLDDNNNKDDNNG